MELAHSIEEYDLVFLDVETTGLSPSEGDVICEIGAVKISGGREKGRFYSLVNPQRDMPYDAYRIHGISNDDLKQAPVFEDIADEFISFLNNEGKGVVICAYNIEFDVAFINHALEKVRRPLLEFPTIDILKMARKIVKAERYNLKAMVDFFNIQPQGKLHRALEDAFVTGRIFFELLERLKGKGLNTLEDFVVLFGMDNSISRSKKDAQVLLLKEAIARKIILKMRYLSSSSTIEEIRMQPVSFCQQNRSFYLQYKSLDGTECRLDFSRVVEVGRV
jgi:DNA polymerase-3 subunit epsilon